jgi:hypothetical protein
MGFNSAFKGLSTNKREMVAGRHGFVFTSIDGRKLPTKRRFFKLMI